MVPAQPPGSAPAPVVEDRTARVAFHRPQHWQAEPSEHGDLRIVGDGVTIEVRSRPSDNAIADEHLALLGRLPGSSDGVLVVAADPWTTAGAPARLVEYLRPGADGPAFVSHLLIATGRHRVEVTAERALDDLLATDDVVFDVLDSVRAREHVRGVDLVHETLPTVAAPPIEVGPHLGAEAFGLLQSLAGRRWNPSMLRTPGSRDLIDAGFVGRFGTLPSSTSELLAPWAAGAEPRTLDQRADGGTRSRLQYWQGEDPETRTVVDGSDATGYRVGVLTVEQVVRLLAAQLDVHPTWTWAFRTNALPAAALSARLSGSRASLPADHRDDEVLGRFWEAGWTVSGFRTGNATPMTLVGARGVGLARVGATTDGVTAFRAESPAVVFRRIVRGVLA